MTDATLETLEAHIIRLLSNCAQLRSENASLQQTNQQLIDERAHLLNRNSIARTKIETLLQQLKQRGSS